MIRALVVVGCLLASVGTASTASAQGWYLMAPPLRDDGDPDIKRPIGEWEVMNGFDTARACESLRIQLLGHMEKKTKEDIDAAGKRWITGNPGNPLTTEEGERALKSKIAEDRVRASRCISAADSRLQRR